ncbi:MAG TPA: M24 family metallopeptidase [Gemmataceae bacterium]|nr:M24 family metallopeptidase [Gemmataceae bacterium]
MTLTAETMVIPSLQPSANGATGESDRRADVDAKQAQVAALLNQVGCEGLLLLEPENFSWLTSGAAARGVLDPADLPVLYLGAEQRWVMSCNVDTQRLFDEELDGLGFQLKEWSWQSSRESLLADVCHGRKIACDRVYGAFTPVGDQLSKLRWPLTLYEKACYQALGATVSHALEATCRTMSPGETEREIAGQLSHRLLHRGAQPLAIEVAADGRSRRYRQCGFTSAPVTRYCVLSVHARKYGLCATASRSVCFGQPDQTFRREHDAACKVSATYIASTWPDALPRQILNTGRHVYQVTGFEHEWRLCPQGQVTGRLPVERKLTPQTEDLFQNGWAIAWHASVGAAFSSDTCIVTEEGARVVTVPEMWPLKRIRVQGAEFFRPDILLREQASTA